MTTPATEMGIEPLVERVARALCAANFKQQGAEGEFGTVDDCWWAWRDEARAAIAAFEATRTPEAAQVEMRELLLDWRNSWLCPVGHFDGQRLVKATDSLLGLTPIAGEYE